MIDTLLSLARVRSRAPADLAARWQRPSFSSRPPVLLCCQDPLILARATSQSKAGFTVRDKEQASLLAWELLCSGRTSVSIALIPLLSFLSLVDSRPHVHLTLPSKARCRKEE